MSNPGLRRLVFALCGALLVPFGGQAAHDHRLTLQPLLARVGDYVRQYERSFSAIVCREEYVQRARSGGFMETRALRSEVALVPVDGNEWVLFRDVYEIDGRKISEHEGRLTGLFQNPPSDAALLARRIAEEGAKYNLGNISRTVNTPTVALMFLRPERQAGSKFRVSGRRTIASVRATELRFQETGMPRVIKTHDGAPASGQVWVDSETGTVLRTQLQLATAGVSAVITVDYALEGTLKLWVPVRMVERYALGQRGVGAGAADALDHTRNPTKDVIEGSATYDRFQRFAVDTKTTIRP